MSKGMAEESETNSPMEQEDTGEEEEEEEEEDEEEEGAENSHAPESPEKKRHCITGRGVTLAMLMVDGIVEPGDGVMSIDYLGKRFKADLLPSGKIRGKGGTLFSSPSAWAIHCKKIVNPAKKSGCGWASVKYKGRKLDTYKSTWFRRQQPAGDMLNPVYYHSFLGESKNDTPPGQDIHFCGDLPSRPSPSHPDQQSNGNPLNGQNGVHTEGEREKQSNKPLHNSKKQRLSESDRAQRWRPSLASLSFSESLHGAVREERRVIVEHSRLGSRNPEHDQNTLIECRPFSALGKIQPFTVSVSSTCLLLMDFHSHLTTSEVVGYLAGKWDPNLQHLQVTQAFPCRCRLGDKEGAIMVEEEIRQNIERHGLCLVGWYHSHPSSSPDPTIKDVTCQMEYQLKMKGEGTCYNPCLAMIVSPYDPYHGSKEAALQAYWVMPPPETHPLHYGMPMSMTFTMAQDTFLSQDVVNEMKWLTDFYKGAPDMIAFSKTWKQSVTYQEKIKASLTKKLPKDQMDGRMMDYIMGLLIH